jgi:hypothetical protein
MQNTDAERRRRRRVKVQMPLRLDYGSNEALASTKNVSLLGACLSMDRPISPGTRVALSLDIPNYTEDNRLIGEVKGEGAIVRCDSVSEGQSPDYESGLFFSSFLPGGEEKLANYLDFVADKEEKEIRQWVQQYRAHIKARKKKIANKKKALARKRAARLAIREKRLRQKEKMKEKRISKKISEPKA